MRKSSSFLARCVRYRFFEPVSFIVGMSIPIIAYWAYSSRVTQNQIDVKIAEKSEKFQHVQNQKTLKLSESQVREAATWWAQFLRPKKKSLFDKNASKEQVEEFITILSEKIKHQNYEGSPYINESYTDNPYFQIGHISFYGPPPIIDKILSEMGIFISFLHLQKFEMRLYQDGSITVNGKRVDYMALPDLPCFKK